MPSLYHWAIEEAVLYTVTHYTVALNLPDTVVSIHLVDAINIVSVIVLVPDFSLYFNPRCVF